VAVVPPAGIRAALADEIAHLSAVARAVAWVAPDNLHVTLKFLGQTPAERLEPIADALAAVAARHSAFDLDVLGLGAFPTLTRARVIWAGLAAGAPRLAGLAADVEEALVPLGFAPEGRPFAAHITLGRVREPRRDDRLAAALGARASRAFGRIRVEDLILMRSDLSPRGARYTPLGTSRLAAS
jgi:2'-5' RNA ligase